MSQQYPPQQAPGRGQPGRGGGGRGPAHGGAPSNYTNYGGRGGGGAGGSMGAWQPAAPTSMQGHPAQQGYQPGPPPQGGPPRGPVPYGGPPGGGYYQPQMYHQPQPYNTRGGWQGSAGPGHYGGHHQNHGAPHRHQMHQGGVYYPPQHQQHTHTPAGMHAQHQPPAPRQKKPLVITDKQGNVVDLSAVAKKPAAAAPAASASAAAATATPSPDAGAKLKQAALQAIESGTDKKQREAEAKARKEAEENAKAEEEARKEAEEKAKKEAEEKARQEAEDQAKREADEKAKKEAEEKARLEAEEKAKKEAEEKATAEKAQKEAEEKARVEAEAKEAELKAKKDADAKRGRLSLAERLQQPAVATNGSGPSSSSNRIVFTRQALLDLQDPSRPRPEALPDMTITKTAHSSSRGKSGGGGGGGGGRRGSDRANDQGEWARGAQQPRRQSQNDTGGGAGGGQWTRGQAPPKQQNRDNRGGNRQRSMRGGPQPFYDGPVAPLVKSENHWKPKKNTSAFVIAEKKVKSILNKMTKEKFNRLADQMIEVQIFSAEMLTMMINNVYEKAIDEPSFGDMYADLCVRLSQSAQVSSFVHIIESDEEPPTEDGTAAPAGGESSSHTVYRWSNDVSTTDSEVVGPFESADACFDAVLSESAASLEPEDRGDITLELVSVSIKKGIFVKIMKKKEPAEGEELIFYTVFFPVSEATECGQQLSSIFLSEVECVSDASKKNSFKRSLLNKCEEEFNKQDIYVDWKKEMKAYQESKSSLKDAERAEKEEELEFRRMRIKKQMLGNVKFIGQLYKKGLLKEKIMRFCILSLLKLDSGEDSMKTKSDNKDDKGEMDEEDHEAICSIFTTIGATIDTPEATAFMDTCFSKIGGLAKDKNLPSRSRFMYKDLLDLRANRWVPRRKEEKAKTLDEIRKDVEREERRQAQQSAAGNSRGGPGRGDYMSRPGGRGDPRGSRMPSQSSVSRPRQQRSAVEVDDDGFTSVVSGSKSNFNTVGRQSRSNQSRSNNTNAPASSSSRLSSFAVLSEEPAASKAPAPAPAPSGPAALDSDALERRIKSMRNDFLSDGGDEGELLLTMAEISGTPNAGETLVQKNGDQLMDCKDAERQAIVKMISILFRKGSITSSDLENGLRDIIEFIDGYVCDAPRAYEYLGELLAEMLRIQALDVAWICERTENTKMSDPTAAEKLIRALFQAITKGSGAAAARDIGNKSASALSKLLTDSVWAAIAQEL